MFRLALLFLLLPLTFFAQKSRILDIESNEGIPFVKIIGENNKQLLTDIDGFFELTPKEKFTVKYSEYKDTNFIFENGINYFITPLAISIEDVVILPGENPSERIMREAIKMRSENHPQNGLAHKYTSYSKMHFTLNPEALAAISDTTTDSTLIRVRNYFTDQHLFLMENTTEKVFDPPYREKEIIKAYKVSGLSDPQFSTFASELQSFHFYDAQFSILGKNYSSPLAFGSINRYFFILEDSFVNPAGDTTFTIRFRPRKNKTFDALQGVLYVNSRKYALEKLNVSPVFQDSTAEARIVQEYAFIDNKKWFPIKLSSEIDMKINALPKLKNSYLIGRGTTYIDSIQLNPDVSDIRFSPAQVQVSNDANEKDSSFWTNSRKYELSKQDVSTYTFVDSISKKYKLENKFMLLSSLVSGKIPLGKFQLDLKRLADYKEYEGTRLGLGIETSDKLMKRATIGGWGGYGFVDKAWKYGGYSSILLWPAQFLKLDLAYSEEVLERGGYFFQSSELSLSQNYTLGNFSVTEMEKQRKAQAGVTFFLFPRVKLGTNFSYQRLRITDNYAFDNRFSNTNNLEQAEWSNELIWNIGEKISYLGNKRVSLGSTKPSIRLQYTRGVSGFYESKLDYDRIVGEIQQRFKPFTFLQVDYLIAAGMVSKNVPFYLFFNQTGTQGIWKLDIPFSLQTLPSNTVYMQEFGAFFLRVQSRTMKTKVKFFQPIIGVHHAIAFGNYYETGKHSKQYNSWKLPYSEVGLFVKNIYKSGSSGIGLGFYYRYDENNSSNFKENIAVKLTIGN